MCKQAGQGVLMAHTTKKKCSQGCPSYCGPAHPQTQSVHYASTPEIHVHIGVGRGGAGGLHPPIISGGGKAPPIF